LMVETEGFRDVSVREQQATVSTGFEGAVHPKHAGCADDLHLGAKRRAETAVELGHDAARKSKHAGERDINAGFALLLPTEHVRRSIAREQTRVAHPVAADIPQRSAAESWTE